MLPMNVAPLLFDLGGTNSLCFTALLVSTMLKVLSRS